MLQRALVASRLFVGPSRCPAFFVQTRSLITPSAIRAADLVQDMYLKELKAYKVPPAKSSDAQGQVQTFKIPSPPKAPSDTSEMAESLKAYDTQPVEVEMQSTSSGPGATLPSKDEEWLELDEDEPAESGKASH